MIGVNDRATTYRFSGGAAFGGNQPPADNNLYLQDATSMTTLKGFL
jgi:hypothetical protein